VRPAAERKRQDIPCPLARRRGLVCIEYIQIWGAENDGRENAGRQNTIRNQFPSKSYILTKYVRVY